MIPFYKYVYLLVGTNILPHITDQPLWVVLVSLLLLLWRFASDKLGLPLPGKWGIFALVVLATVLVAFQFGAFFGEEPSTAILLIMASLKTFEMKSHRDVMILTYLCYFLLMTKLIASQTIAVSVFMVIDVLVITGFMMMFHSPKEKRLMGKLFLSSFKTAVIALPLVGVLFFIFPRFTAQLWSAPSKNTAISGFSTFLKPGEISRLMLSEETAFRVFFKDNLVPPRSMLYWRSLTLSKSRGLEWEPGQRGIASASRPQSPLKDTSESTLYEVMLEPHGSKWLVALDWPMSLTLERDYRRVSLLKYTDQSYEMSVPLSQRVNYSAASQQLSNLVEWRIEPGPEHLEVDETRSPKAKAWAEELKASSLSSVEKVNTLLENFEKGGFSYSLQPPLASSLDAFLFETKSGFCEHYAAALASLLRWAGVPARVVLGYQGGTFSFFKDYLLIRQLDAHAWVEYWDSARKTWIRIDPTERIAPSRVIWGAERFNETLERGADRDIIAGLNFSEWLGGDLRREYLRLMLAFDQVEAAWISFLLVYDFEYQKSLLARWGIQLKNRVPLFLISGLSLFIILALTTLALKWREQKRGYEEKIYDLLCRQLAKRGLPRRDNEGPLAYKARVLNGLEGDTGSLETLIDEILEYRYGPSEAKTTNRTLRYRQLRQNLKKTLKKSDFRLKFSLGSD